MVSDSRPALVVLDANILIAVIRPTLGHVSPDEAAASARVMAAVNRGELHGYLIAPALAEIIHVLGRNGISDRERTVAAARWRSMPGRLDVVDLDASLAVAAGEYRQRHYHRERLALSYIDCFCVTLAQNLGAVLVTAEEPLLRAPNVIVLPPSHVL